MKKSILALPALAILLGVGGAGTAYAHGMVRADLSDEQLASLESVKELMHAGKIDEAKALAAEAGLPGLRHGGRMRIDPEEKQALQAALDANDYESFKELTAEAPFADELTPEAFAQLVQARTLMEAGDMEGARELLAAAGLEIPLMGKHQAHNEGQQPWRDDLSDEQRDLLDQARKLHQSGDHEAAREIIESLDLPELPGRHFRR